MNYAWSILFEYNANIYLLEKQAVDFNNMDRKKPSPNVPDSLFGRL